MKFFERPLWLVGFRPFFALAMLAGMLLPALWVLVLGGVLPAPPGRLSPLQWHVHEMFFGFGWAVMGGFLLTSTKNWVGVRGYHGGVLAFLAVAWAFERIAMAWGGAWPPALFALAANLYLVAIAALLAWTLVCHRRTDSYPDNPVFLVILPAFLVAKALVLSPEHFQAGWSMALGLFRMAFLVMLERTLTQFMKGAFQVALLRRPALDLPIKLTGLALVGVAWMPTAAAVGLEVLLALLLAVRLAFWHPRLAARRLDIGIMYLGYACIVAQLAIDAFDRLGLTTWVGAVGVHVFTLGVMGLIVPAMLVRICKGHTGRKVVFEPADKAVLYIMLAGLLFRVAAPQLAPSAYLAWLGLAAACWLAGFAILAGRYIPYLLQPRIDGREH